MFDQVLFGNISTFILIQSLQRKIIKLLVLSLLYQKAATSSQQLDTLIYRPQMHVE